MSVPGMQGKSSKPVCMEVELLHSEIHRAEFYQSKLPVNLKIRSLSTSKGEKVLIRLVLGQDGPGFPGLSCFPS